jgi:malate dehydrogenase (quinone)
MTASTHYDVLIVGAGVTGTALLYELAKFTDIKRLCLVEKYDSIAQVSSNAHSNSQTIHSGDIETNYSLEKARQIKRTADMALNYAAALPPRERDTIIFQMPKMLLGVGEQECAYIRRRYERFKLLYPRMRLLEPREIANIEPNVALIDGAWRREEIVATGTLDDYCAIDFQQLAHSFSRACVRMDRTQGKQITQLFSTKVDSIARDGAGYVLKTNRGLLQARVVAVCTGGHALLMAQEMGIGLNYSCVPIGGSFYFAPEALNGKVYTVQNPAVPFSAVHGDHDIKERGKTRFGPTAVMLPMLERHNRASLSVFMQSLRPDRRIAKILWGQLREHDIRNDILRNLMYEVPGLHRRLFVRAIRKIVPSMTVSDISYAQGFGGIRPLLIDKAAGTVRQGEAKLTDGAGMIFNMTPSPGGTNCLGSGEADMRSIARYLGAQIDEPAFKRELLTGTDQSPSHARHPASGHRAAG